MIQTRLHHDQPSMCTFFPYTSDAYSLLLLRYLLVTDFSPSTHFFLFSTCSLETLVARISLSSRQRRRKVRGEKIGDCVGARVRSFARVRACVGVRVGVGREGGGVEEEHAGRRETGSRYDRREDLVNNARPPVVVASSHPCENATLFASRTS